jgi:hypothetical protein
MGKDKKKAEDYSETLFSRTTPTSSMLILARQLNK